MTLADGRWVGGWLADGRLVGDWVDDGGWFGGDWLVVLGSDGLRVFLYLFISLLTSVLG